MGAKVLVVDDSPTIRKVVASILARHDYEAEEAADGLQALQAITKDPPDLVLVDFVMPNMNGHQLCLALRDKPETAELPVVLMSAKADKVRGKFVQQTGALDAITKPFDARALLAVIEGALDKKAEGAHRSDQLAPEDELASSPGTGSSPQINLSGLKLSERLATIATEQIAGWGVEEQAALAGAFARALTPDLAADLAAHIADVALGSPQGEALSGDLGAISIAEILQLLDMQRKTGALILGHGKSRVTLFMREGALDFATYTGLPEEFLLGRYLVSNQVLEREVLDDLIDVSRASGMVLGDFLVSQNAASEDQLRAALVQQTSELLYEVVRWRKGRFRFVQQAENELAERTQLGLPTMALVMEGFRRVDEWRLIEDSFDFSDVLFRDELAVTKLTEQKELTDLEHTILAAADGARPGAEILDAAEGSSFESCKVLYRLLNSRLLKRRTS